MDTCNYRVSTKHKAIVIPFDDRVTQLIPHGREYRKNGRRFHIVPYGNTETKLLNNLGFTIPAPILSQYNWAGSTPFDSQRDTARLLTENRRAYVLNDMGTGKTRAALFACDYLMASREIQRALIIAPLSTLTTVWEREIFSIFSGRRAVALHGTKEKRLKLLAEPADFYIINHDGLGVIEKELAARTDINAIIIDELAILRNHRTARWKVANRLCRPRKFVWGMTGGPMPKAPTDAYGQIKLLTPERVPDYMKSFQSKTMIQITQFKWIPKKEANDIVYAAMQPAVRYSRDDCVDLPPTTYSTREVEMMPKQKKAYKEMLRKFVVKYAEGEIVAANAGVQVSKLLQIGGGFTYGANGLVVDIDCQSRLSELTEILDEAQRKVIVFAPFKHTVNYLKSHLDLYGHSVESIHGDVNKTERDEIFNLFQNSPEPQILVAHPQTMAHGLTLTAADTIVWYLPMPNLEIYEQANARITRPSQEHNTHIIHIQASPAEKRIYSTLQQRGDMQASLLSLFRQ